MNSVALVGLTTLGLAGCAATQVAGPSDRVLRTAILGAFEDNNCVISGKNTAESEQNFEVALARRLNVPVSAVEDREGDIFKRGDKIVEDMIERGEIKVSYGTALARLLDCTPRGA